MANKPLHIPSALFPIHGKTPAQLDLLLVHGLGLSFAAALLLAFGAELSLLQGAALFILAWDMTGGVIANATRSTNDWYADQSPWVRRIFVIAHIYQPLLAMWAFPRANPFVFIGLYLFVLVSALPLLNFNERPDVQKPLAMGLLAAGLLLFSLLPAGEPALAWFPLVYLVKLIYSFAVDHYSTAALGA